MEGILRILVVVIAIVASGNARRNSFAYRYGGRGFKRPTFGVRPGVHAPAYVSPLGGSYGPVGAPGSALGHVLPSAPTSFSYGSGGYSSSYNAPGGIAGQSHNNLVGAPVQNIPSVSYSRPFGLPEGQRFPYGGFTYKVPSQKLPRPPLKSAYKSKPYPDFIVRFKSPLYPSEVSVFNKRPARPSSAAVLGRPVYEPGETPEAFGVGGAQKLHGVIQAAPPGISVGASYQTNVAPTFSTGSRTPVPAAVLPAGSPKQPLLLPPSTSIYLFRGEDKIQLDRPSSNTSTAFIGLSKDAAFGSTVAPGVVRPLQPDIVYSTNDREDFKPTYIFGPVYFPKNDTATTEAKVASANAASETKSPAGSESTLSECSEKDSSSSKCNLKSSEAPQTSTTTTTAAPSTENTSATEDEAEEEEEAAADEDDEAEGGGGRGLIGVLKGILGVDDVARDEEEDHVSRADSEKSSKKKSKPSNRDEEEEDEPSGNRRRRPSLSSTKQSSGFRRGSSKSRVSSGSRRKSSAGKSKPGSRREPAGGGEVDQPPEEADEAEEKAQTDREKTESSEPSGFVPDQWIEGERGPPPMATDNDPDPIVGPVQIGYIGNPPPGANYNPYQPFFYPAGVPAYGYNPLGHNSEEPSASAGFEADHTQNPPQSNEAAAGGGSDVRRSFHGSDVGAENFVNHNNDDDVVQGGSLSHEDQGDVAGRPSAVGTPEFEDSRQSQGLSDETMPESGDLASHPDEVESSQDVDTVLQSTTAYVPQDDDSHSHQHGDSEGSSADEFSTVTAPDVHEERVTHNQPASSQRASHLHVNEHHPEDSYLMSDESNINNNEAVVAGVSSKNDVTENSPSTLGGDVSTLKSYQSLDDQAAASSTDGVEDKHSYASVTRKPFPSSYRYRTSYRPNSNNYVEPTTYRPAFRLPPGSSSDKDVTELPASRHDDGDHPEDHGSVGTVLSNAIEQNHLDNGGGNAEALVQVHEVTEAPEYGSRIASSKSVQ